jgi:hypothetical protein
LLPPAPSGPIGGSINNSAHRYAAAVAGARERVAEFWDEHVRLWLAGADPLPDPLPDWYACYQGTGAGSVTRDGFCEPYAGDLLGSPRMVVLGLNPGRFFPRFQARNGVFADEIREHGSYRRWMATAPYFRSPWTTEVGPNRYYLRRLTFARRWLDDPTVAKHELLIFEAYPWHSISVTAAMKPPGAIIDEFVWQPIAEIDVPVVFAFGKPWHHVADKLGLPLAEALGLGGRPFGSAVPGRAVRIYELPQGQRLVVEWHAGDAGPPGASEVVALRAALT